MKKIFILLLLFVSPAFAQYQTIDSFCEFYTQIILCSNKNENYVLIQNDYDIFPEYLVIYSDDKFSARQVYGEILLKYYHIKNMKKEWKNDGEWFYTIKDNSENEIVFLRALTDQFNLLDYPTFNYIDNSYSKDETVEFYDIAEDMYKEDEIGSAAGVLMGINATDFINFLKSIKE